MNVLVHRTGDDAPTPHAKLFHVPDSTTLGDFFRLVREFRYLPNLVGGRATWMVEGDRPLAVVAQELRDPWPLVGLRVPLAQVAGGLPRPHFEFRLVPHRSPEDVFREIGGDPVRLPKEAWEASPEISWNEAIRQFFTPRS